MIYACMSTIESDIARLELLEAVLCSLHGLRDSCSLGEPVRSSCMSSVACGLLHNTRMPHTPLYHTPNIPRSKTITSLEDTEDKMKDNMVRFPLYKQILPSQV